MRAAKRKCMFFLINKLLVVAGRFILEHIAEYVMALSTQANKLKKKKHSFSF